MGFALFALAVRVSIAGEVADLESRVSHAYADSGGVRIHYAALGSGPLIVMIHGFPDFWLTWRGQMPLLADQYQCVAMDLRGYNLSDKPKGLENYDMKHLVDDVASVIRSVGKEKAVICGHDWGGMVAWNFAMTKPEMTDRLIVLNMPHPRGWSRELTTNPRQQKASQYGRRMQEPGAAERFKPETFAARMKDPELRKSYQEAFQRSDVEAMMSLYAYIYPPIPTPAEGLAPDAPNPAWVAPPIDPGPDAPKVVAPTLVIHGLKDPVVLAGGLSGTWDWIAADLTIVTIPGAGHFVQHEEADFVSRTIKQWLNRDGK